MTSSQLLSSRILIVDDEPAVRKLIAAIIGFKYSCTTASSAEEALKCLDQEVYDLVVTDVNLGGMNGMELMERINDSAPDTVVMLISGNQTIDGPIGAIRGGAFDYLRKPFNTAEVIASVDRAIEHRKHLVNKRDHDNELERLVEERTRRLNFLAYHDSLTGLPNRAAFEEKLSVQLGKNDTDTKIAVMVISLERCSTLRDTLGHKMNDRLLMSVADRLEDLKGNGFFLARLDGDRFVVMLKSRSIQETKDFAEKVLSAFEAPFPIGEYKVFVPLRIGIRQTTDDGADAQTLLRNAGAALTYARKQGNISYQLYNCGIHDAAVKRLTLENDLRAALAASEFELFYQPKVDMRSGKITGMEALVRWNHPRFGLVPPLDFIPLAEETGLIVPLGEWILRAACTQTKQWRDRGYELNVAVNVSPAQFQQKDLAVRLISIVRATGLDPRFLNLEVTEGLIMNNTSDVAEVLADLRATGITVSIDDFGTGQSSLSYLKRLPVDVLKIDKSFVDEVAADPDDAAMVMAIITLAHTLRLKVVAEGVETEEQLRLLRLVRADEWQGYLASKPLNASAFTSFLLGRKERGDPHNDGNRDFFAHEGRELQLA
ncbi:MAG: EAL domain-containing protein [Pyrinomonadaceae bacterium]